MHADDAGPASSKTDVARRSDLGGAVLNPLLRMAIITGVEAAVLLHISRGDDLNARDSDGHTPLMLCALRNRHRICALLLAAGANAEVTSPQGQTAYEMAVKKGAAEVAELLTPATIEPTVDNIERPYSATAEEPISEYSSAADLDAWEPEEEHVPPLESPELATQASLVHNQISHHAPQDFSTEWDDIDACLPELAQAPTHLRDDDVRSALRLIFLRGMREGSVPDMSIKDIAEVLDIDCEHDLAPHLRRILGDIGAETDERFEYVAQDDDFTVHVAQEASEQDEEVISEALMRLDSIVSRRHEPIRQYLRSIQGHPLLSGAEELQLGQEMDSSLQQAIDLVATDGAAVRYVLDAVRHVQIGTRRFGSISRGWHNPLETTTDTAADEEQQAVITAPLARPTDQYAEPDDDADGIDSDEVGQLDSIAQSLAAHLSAATSSCAEEGLREILNSLRLSAGFLFELADANDGWQSTTSKMSFNAAMQRYRQAHDRMTTSNLKLVFSIAKKYVYSGLPLEDLVQEGNLGLIKAVERYDWRKGFRFSTFATWWIRQQISRSVPDSGRTVRLPVHVHEKVQSLRWMIRKYEAANGETPSQATMSEAMSMHVDKVAPLLTYMEDICSIDDVDVDRLADPDFITRFHSCEPETLAAGKEEAAKVAELLNILPRKQRSILRLRYGIGVRDALTLEEVGQGMGVTRERVRQLESKALGLLRHPARIEWLEGRPSAHLKHQVESLDAEIDQDVLPIAKAKQSPSNIGTRRDSNPADRIPLKERRSQLDQLLEQARALAIEVDDDRHGNSGRVWVGLDSHDDAASRKLVRRMLDLGFEHWPGKGYWK